MLNNEFTTVPNIELTAANTNEIDFSLETLQQLVPTKLLALYPDAKIAVVQPTLAGRELTIVISSESAELEAVSMGKSILAAYEQGLLYCSIQFMSLKGESTQTIAYIPKHDDIPEIRHKGINAEFYEKLYVYLKSQGIKYVFGINKIDQAGTHDHFFLEKLGRSKYDELPDEFVRKIPDRFLFSKASLTVQFL